MKSQQVITEAETHLNLQVSRHTMQGAAEESYRVLGAAEIMRGGNLHTGFNSALGQILEQRQQATAAAAAAAVADEDNEEEEPGTAAQVPILRPRGGGLGVDFDSADACEIEEILEKVVFDEKKYKREVIKNGSSVYLGTVRAEVSTAT